MDLHSLAKLERKTWPLISNFPDQAVRAYSKGRKQAMRLLAQELPEESYMPPKELGIDLWGIHFRAPIMNAAGMFKNGECYELVSRQGAGGYTSGTNTHEAWDGNTVRKVANPFVPYRRSDAASNALGLPNDGAPAVARRIADIDVVDGCPVVASLMGHPGYENRDDKLSGLESDMHTMANAGVQVIELNESCPNTDDGKPQDSGLAFRLRYIETNFLDFSNVPVVVKFSNDTPVEQVAPLMELLYDCGFSGVNFGNTSTDYAKYREAIHPADRKVFDHFTKHYKGGLSGKLLKIDSLNLATEAARYVDENGSGQEFHVFRTGGVQNSGDIVASMRAGIDMNQWFGGYFEGLEKHEHDVYRVICEEVADNI